MSDHSLEQIALSGSLQLHGKTDLRTQHLCVFFAMKLRVRWDDQSQFHLSVSNIKYTLDYTGIPIEPKQLSFHNLYF